MMEESDFDKAQHAFFREVPDMIAGKGEWETIKYCANCEGILTDDMACMHYTAQGENERVPDFESPFAPSVIACPHCRKLPPAIKLYSPSKKVQSASAISFKLVRRRKIYTFIPGFWGSMFGKETKFFYEYSKEFCGGGEEVQD